MGELENEKAKAEAVEETAADRRSSSANRARLWAGLNRYLASVMEHERKVAKREHEAEEASKTRRPPRHRTP
jgi:hypothetical protein